MELRLGGPPFQQRLDPNGRGHWVLIYLPLMWQYDTAAGQLLNQIHVYGRDHPGVGWMSLDCPCSHRSERGQVPALRGLSRVGNGDRYWQIHRNLKRVSLPFIQHDL